MEPTPNENSRSMEDEPMFQYERLIKGWISEVKPNTPIDALSESDWQDIASRAHIAGAENMSISELRRVLKY